MLPRTPPKLRPTPTPSPTVMLEQHALAKTNLNEHIKDAAKVSTSCNPNEIKTHLNKILSSSQKFHHVTHLYIKYLTSIASTAECIKISDEQEIFTKEAREIFDRLKNRLFDLSGEHYPQFELTSENIENTIHTTTQPQPDHPIAPHATIPNILATTSIPCLATESGIDIQNLCLQNNPTLPINIVTENDPIVTSIQTPHEGNILFQQNPMIIDSTPTVSKIFAQPTIVDPHTLPHSTAASLKTSLDFVGQGQGVPIFCNQTRQFAPLPQRHAQGYTPHSVPTFNPSAATLLASAFDVRSSIYSQPVYTNTNLHSTNEPVNIRHPFEPEFREAFNLNQNPILQTGRRQNENFSQTNFQPQSPRFQTRDRDPTHELAKNLIYTQNKIDLKNPNPAYTFDGSEPENYFSWLSSFYYSLQQAGCNNSPKDVLLFLKAHLKGEALNIFKVYAETPVTAPEIVLDNVLVALKETYGSPEVLFRRFEKLIGDLPVISEQENQKSITQTRQLLTKARQIDFINDQVPGLLYQFTHVSGINKLAEKMPRSFQNAWRSFYLDKRELRLPEASMGDFIIKVTRHLRQISEPLACNESSRVRNRVLATKFEHSTRDTEGQPELRPQIPRESIENNDHRFHNSNNSPRIDRTPISKQYYCGIHPNSTTHTLFSCSVFKNASYMEKIDLLQKLQKCYKCAGNHFASSCQSTATCKNCERSHATILCPHVTKGRPLLSDPRPNF